MLQQPVDASELVDRVAKRYLEMKEFLVEYRQNVEAMSTLGPGGAHTTTIKVAKSGERYFYEESGYSRFQIFGDRETSVRYHPSSKEYVEEPAGLRNDQVARDGLKAAFLRFRMLDGQAMNARLLRMDKRKVKGKKIQCAVVQISSPRTLPVSWVERLWIDPETAMVYRSEFESTANSTFSRQARTNREFFTPAGAQSPDPALLEFHPPKGAKQVDRFSVQISID